MPIIGTGIFGFGELTTPSHIMWKLNMLSSRLDDYLVSYVAFTQENLRLAERRTAYLFNFTWLILSHTLRVHSQPVR